jgi:hypothetical protein
MHARKRGVESFEKLSREGKVKRKSMSMEKKRKKESVGDRPRGPLKQWGNPHLSSCIKIS